MQLALQYEGFSGIAARPHLFARKIVAAGGDVSGRVQESLFRGQMGRIGSARFLDELQGSRPEKGGHPPAEQDPAIEN
jgi:hypothetical protein